MAGTRAGGLKAAAKNKSKYGKDFYTRIGKKGGRNGRTGGFYNNPELARHAGQKGGKIGGLKSKRGKAKAALAAQPYPTKHTPEVKKIIGGYLIYEQEAV